MDYRFRWKRGNIENETDRIIKPLIVEIETKSITVHHLKNAFEKVSKIKRSKPKIGRPLKSELIKLSEKQEKLFTIKRQLRINFNNNYVI